MTKYGTYMKTEDSVMIKDDVPRHFLYKNNLLTMKVKWVFRESSKKIINQGINFDNIKSLFFI